MAYELNINGKTTSVDVDADTPLLWVVRDSLKLTGTKFGCGVAALVPALCISTDRPCVLVYYPYQP